MYTFNIDIDVLHVKIEFRDFFEAENALDKRQVWGLIHFGKEFSKTWLLRRAMANKYANLETITGSQITVTLDWSNKLFCHYINIYHIFR